MKDEEETEGLFLENNEISTKEPEFHAKGKKDCREKKIFKYTICCYFRSLSLSEDEIKAYRANLLKYGSIYNDKNPDHEENLKKLHLMIFKTLQEQTPNPDQGAGQSELELDSNLWLELGFQVLYYVIKRKMIHVAISEVEVI